MTTPPTDELTDERLAAIEDRWTENGMIHGDIHVLIQEVRRLRDERSTTNDAIWSVDPVKAVAIATLNQRAEKAERTLSKHHPNGGQSCDQCAE